MDDLDSKGRYTLGVHLSIESENSGQVSEPALALPGDFGNTGVGKRSLSPTVKSVCLTSVGLCVLAFAQPYHPSLVLNLQFIMLTPNYIS